MAVAAIVIQFSECFQTLWPVWFCRSSKELLLTPVVISRNDKEKVLIESSINSIRISIAVKQVTSQSHRFLIYWGLPPGHLAPIPMVTLFTKPLISSDSCMSKPHSHSYRCVFYEPLISSDSCILSPSCHGYSFFYKPLISSNSCMSKPHSHSYNFHKFLISSSTVVVSLWALI